MFINVRRIRLSAQACLRLVVTNHPAATVEALVTHTAFNLLRGTELRRASSAVVRPHPVIIIACDGEKKMKPSHLLRLWKSIGDALQTPGSVLI